MSATANNGRIPLASGIHVDGKDRLCWVVEYLLSPAHKEALSQEQLDEAWHNTSDSHPWVKLMKNCKAETLEFLLRLAVDAYNDCRVETLSARRLPSRSLAIEHLIIYCGSLEMKDRIQSLFLSTSPALYITTCAEMRDIIGQQEMKKTSELWKDCLCYSAQIDCSADRQQVDSKLIARFVPPEEVSVNAVFLGISSSDIGGSIWAARWLCVLLK